MTEDQKILRVVFGTKALNVEAELHGTIDIKRNKTCDQVIVFGGERYRIKHFYQSITTLSCAWYIIRLQYLGPTYYYYFDNYPYVYTTRKLCLHALLAGLCHPETVLKKRSSAGCTSLLPSKYGQFALLRDRFSRYAAAWRERRF